MFIKRSGVVFIEAAVPDAGAGASGGGVPAAGATGATAAGPAAGATAEKDPEQEAKWLKGRLEQAKTSGEKAVLKTLGVDKIEDAKAALDRLKAIDAEKLSADERTAAKIKELEPQAARAATLETTVKGYAEKEFGELTDEQKAAVTRLAGEDPAKVLDTIATLRPTWAAKAAAAAATGATGAAPTETPGASTTSAGKQPAATSTTTTIDHKAEYQRLRASNPVLAAEYRQAHAKEVNGD